jgi:serine/threonine protein kinase/Flp pilus assembly protein TadD
MKLSAPEISTCSTCGAASEETSDGDLGCMVCLLRVGLSGEDQIGEDLLAAADDRFGIYVIERHDDGSLYELGRGAMGVTFCAIDTSLQRKVALKIIKTDLAARSAEARERFMREARAAAALRHENVATVYQFGVREETGQCFYAMELVQGETIDERVRRTGPLDARTIIAIGQQVTAALSAAEKRGLIHRDLKPANLMLVSPADEPTPTNQKREAIVKIIDFGLAKALKHETDPMSLTRDGFVGTPAFASPEQFGNTPLDVRSDIYSLGLTLWFALTGKTPFPGRKVEEIERAQQVGPLPIGQLRAARVPSPLIALLESMLALEPAARPGTQELKARLERCALAQIRRRKRIAFALGAIVVLSTLGWFANHAVTRRDLPSNSQSENIGTTNAAAHEAYLKGLFIWNRRNYFQYQDAEQYFRKAIGLDSSYAQAFAGLSCVLQFLGNDVSRRDQAYADAEGAAVKALTLNPNLAEAHTALGLINMNRHWDWPGAEREFRRAIELNPNYATAHHWYAEFLDTQGRFNEALQEIEQAQQLNPTLAVIHEDAGKILSFAGRLDEAETQLREAIVLNPYTGDPHMWLAQTYAQKKDFSKAFAELNELERLNRNPWSAGVAAYIHGLAGDRAQAVKLLAEAEHRYKADSDYLCLVYGCIGVGDKDRAFLYLERDYKTRATTMTSLRVGPFYDSLRSDPRFADLLRRVHFAP